MSVEALAWALNLAPVPHGSGGRPNPACKAVLIGLANHAGPDGTAAFPSIRTLMRYTGLSRRAVQNALDRLEAGGVIEPCDPAVIAAKIKRADQRPQGWDLAMHLISDDLDDDEIAALEAQFPGLTDRIAALRGTGLDHGVHEVHPVPGPVDNPSGGVQQVHPVIGNPVDNPGYEVQQVHPVEATGCSSYRNGVHLVPERGAGGAPEPPIEPPIEPSTTRAREDRATAAGTGGGGAEKFFAALGEGWPLAAAQRDRLAPLVQRAVGIGWPSDRLAEHVGANTHGIRNPYAVLRTRLAELPELPAVVVRPPWCGSQGCDQETRWREDANGRPYRCPVCHPLAAAAGGESEASQA